MKNLLQHLLSQFTELQSQPLYVTPDQEQNARALVIQLQRNIIAALQVTLNILFHKNELAESPLELHELINQCVAAFNTLMQASTSNAAIEKMQQNSVILKLIKFMIAMKVADHYYTLFENEKRDEDARLAYDGYNQIEKFPEPAEIKRLRPLTNTFETLEQKLENTRKTYCSMADQRRFAIHSHLSGSNKTEVIKAIGCNEMSFQLPQYPHAPLRMPPLQASSNIVDQSSLSQWAAPTLESDAAHALMDFHEISNSSSSNPIPQSTVESTNHLYSPLHHLSGDNSMLSKKSLNATSSAVLASRLDETDENSAVNLFCAGVEKAWRDAMNAIALHPDAAIQIPLMHQIEASAQANNCNIVIAIANAENDLSETSKAILKQLCPTTLVLAQFMHLINRNEQNSVLIERRIEIIHNLLEQFDGYETDAEVRKRMFRAIERERFPKKMRLTNNEISMLAKVAPDAGLLQDNVDPANIIHQRREHKAIQHIDDGSEMTDSNQHSESSDNNRPFDHNNAASATTKTSTRPQELATTAEQAVLRQLIQASQHYKASDLNYKYFTTLATKDSSFETRADGSKQLLYYLAITPPSDFLMSANIFVSILLNFISANQRSQRNIFVNTKSGWICQNVNVASNFNVRDDLKSLPLAKDYPLGTAMVIRATSHKLAGFALENHNITAMRSASTAASSTVKKSNVKSAAGQQQPTKLSLALDSELDKQLACAALEYQGLGYARNSVTKLSEIKPVHLSDGTVQDQFVFPLIIRSTDNNPKTTLNHLLALFTLKSASLQNVYYMTQNGWTAAFAPSVSQYAHHAVSDDCRLLPHGEPVGSVCVVRSTAHYIARNVTSAIPEEKQRELSHKRRNSDAERTQPQAKRVAQPFASSNTNSNAQNNTSSSATAAALSVPSTLQMQSTNVHSESSGFRSLKSPNNTSQLLRTPLIPQRAASNMTSGLSRSAFFSSPETLSTPSSFPFSLDKQASSIVPSSQRNELQTSSGAAMTLVSLVPPVENPTNTASTPDTPGSYQRFIAQFSDASELTPMHIDALTELPELLDDESKALVKQAKEVSEQLQNANASIQTSLRAYIQLNREKIARIEAQAQRLEQGKASGKLNPSI